ncbi:MAG: hypothetical protein ACRDKZ_13390 [Actinomycetota bacterium]
MPEGSANRSATVALASMAAAGLLLGTVAQFLRQMRDPFMQLGAATAPWLTAGFVLTIWMTWPDTTRHAPWRRGIASMGLYLSGWLLSYHSVFAIRESVTAADAWREAAPFALLAVPTSFMLGAAASALNTSTIWRDLSLALPVVWSLPEIVTSAREGWAHAAAVALPTAALALFPLLWVRPDTRMLLRVAIAGTLFGAIGLLMLPVIRSYIHQ